MECEKCKIEFIYVELCPLHAAAPKLLEALKNLILSAKTYKTYGTHNMDFAIDEAKTAIAKAEGKSEESNDCPK